jgi:uroporphyrinogen decarboxylase
MWPFVINKLTFKELLNDPQKAASIFYEVNERLGADFITVGSGSTSILAEALGGAIQFVPAGSPEIASILVKNESDIDRLDIAAALRAERVQWMKAVAEETVRLNKGQRSLFVSARAPFTIAGQLCGLEVLARSLYKNKAFLAKLLRFTTELIYSFCDFMLKVDGLDGVFLADPSASGDVLSKKHFEEAALPAITDLLKRLEPHGKLSLLHICGDISDRLHILPESGVGMISIESKVDIKRAKAILSGKMGVAGNIHPVCALEDMSPPEIMEITRKCLDDAANDGGFMLMPGCAISARVPEESVRSFVRAARNWAPS